MVDKIKGITEKHKYALFIFVFFFIYNFVVVGNFSFPTIDRFCYTLYLVDYRVGFCPELLPGAIYNALFPTTDVKIVNVYVNVLYQLFLLAVSFMLEKFLYKFDGENRFTAFIIVLFFITGPATFAMHTYEIGMFDTYWLYCAVAFLIMVQNKYLKWFVPLIFALSLFAHLGALISFIPFFALIILLEASQNEKASKSYMAVFAVSVLLTATTFIYFTAFEQSNLYLSYDSLVELINERNLSHWSAWPDYFSYALYRVIPDEYNVVMENFVSEGESNFLIRLFGAILRQIKFTSDYITGLNEIYCINFAKSVLFSAPIVFYLYKFVLSFYKKEKGNKLRRFIWLCALCLLPFIFTTSLLFSIDLIRWFGHGVMCLFTLVIYGLYKSSDNEHLKVINNCINTSSCLPMIIYFVLYMMCVVNPFT